MHETLIVGAEEFLRLLTQKDSPLGVRPMVVQDPVVIDGDELLLDRLHIENVTFNGPVTIQNWRREQAKTDHGSLHFQASDFLHSLEFDHIARKGPLSISNCTGEVVNLSECRFDSVFIDHLKTRKLGLSGCSLTKRLRLYDVSFEKLELAHRDTTDRIMTPFVQTDNLVAAEQFRLAGIPVYVPTETVRGAMGCELTLERIA